MVRAVVTVVAVAAVGGAVEVAVAALSVAAVWVGVVLEVWVVVAVEGGREAPARLVLNLVRVSSSGGSAVCTRARAARARAARAALT